MYVNSAPWPCFQTLSRYLALPERHSQPWRAFCSLPDGPHLDDTLWCYGDASLAPGASRSCTGVIILWGDHLISWKSQRQALTAWSAFEAEVDASATTCQTGVPLKILLEQVVSAPVRMVLGSDNAACVVNCVKGSSSTVPTRTRHFGMRCAYIRDQARREGRYIRDQAKREGFEIEHVAGTQIPADALTKVLPRCRLEDSRQKLKVLAAE